MHRPNQCFLARARAACSEERSEVRHEFGLHKQFGEGRVRGIGGGGCQHHFQVRSQFDLAHFRSEVGDTDPSKFSVIFGRNDHLERGLEAGIAAEEFGAALGESRLEPFRHSTSRLRRGRPDAASLHVTHKDVRAVRITCRVLAPTRYRQVVPSAEARTGHGQHHGVTSVGEQVRLRCNLAPIGKTPFGRRCQFSSIRTGRNLFAARSGHQRVSRGSFLQQQFGRLNSRITVKTLDHQVLQKHIGERHQRHASMVNHDVADQHKRLAFGQAFNGEINRVVKSERGRRTEKLEPLEVANRRDRFDHRRQHRRVWRDHQVIAEATFETQSRHTEARVLVGQVQVSHAIRRLGDAPRHASGIAVSDLTTHDQALRFGDQASGGRSQNEGGHQVLEHRTGPRNQCRTATDRGEFAAQMEPVRGWNLEFGDGEKTGQSSLGCEQIVIAWVKLLLGDVETNREEFARRIK